jgi:hypothetical protein
MHIEHVELLQIERNLHDIPRGMERFGEYLKVMLNDEQDDVRFVPLLVMNPMGREHVVERLDQLIALGADQIAAEAVREVEGQFSDLEGDYKHGLVICDDVRGGWTNRYTTDAGLRFGVGAKGSQRGGWITTLLWASEPPEGKRIREEVLSTIYRILYAAKHGTPKTLRQMVRQEGSAALFAGKQPHLDEEDLEYSRYVLAPYLDSDSYPVCIAAMYGDEAARTLGYPPLGLSAGAGFAVGLAEALETGLEPLTPDNHPA